MKGIYLRYLRPGHVQSVGGGTVFLIFHHSLSGGWVAESPLEHRTLTFANYVTLWMLVGFFDLTATGGAILKCVLVAAGPRDYLSRPSEKSVDMMLGGGEHFWSSPTLTMPHTFDQICVSFY